MTGRRIVGDVRDMARAHPRLTVFTLGYLASFAALGVGLGSDVAVPYLVLILGLIVLVCRVDRQFGLGTGVLWGLAAWGCGHMAGGVVPLDGDRTLYNAILGVDLIRFDRVVHFFGFGVATLACGKVMRRWLPRERLTGGSAVMVVLAGLGIGAVNEIVEFFATLMLPHTNVGGYVNTGWDLVFDLLGGITATVWLLRSQQAPGPEPEPATAG